ncbi:MAG: C/D box methylation guide ribonucleoprotein complex aNOP56 subunit, partial [Thermoproteota archaeon]
DRRRLVEFVSTVAVLESRMQISKELLSRDKLIVKAVHVLDSLLNIENAIVNQLREWYSLYFPELSRAVPSHPGYVKLVAFLKRRSSYNVKAIMSLGFDRSRAREIEKLAKESMGPDIHEEDLEPVIELARLWQAIRGYRGALEQYINETVKEIAPNTSTLAGPVVAARLISLAGGLDRLAKLPASTIQVLGASKALFRYLSGRGKPPKHGVIFRVKDVMSSPPKIRGKIARSLAAKLAIAARVDYYGGEYIGDELLSELRERINRIKEEYKAQKRAARAARRGGRRGKSRRT